MKDVEKQILKKLMRRRMISGKHTDIKHVFNIVPRHERKRASVVVKKLIIEELIMKKQTHYGTHINLNPRKIEEIIKRIEN